MDHPPALIARRLSAGSDNRCCGTGARTASLGEQALSRATPGLRSADLHLTVVAPQHRKAIACPTSGISMSGYINLSGPDSVPEPRAAVDSARWRAAHDTIDDWGVFASTTEALTVTILDELLRRTRQHPEVPSEVSRIFDAVYAAELDHWNFISQHFNPSTKRFWIPDGFFGGADDALDLTAVGKGVSGGETLFVNTYLVGVTTFAKPRGPRSSRATRPRPPGTSPSTACLGKRWPAQARPTTSDSRSSSLTASVISKPPWSAPASAWARRHGPGRFYDFPDPPMAPPIQISSNEPR